MMKPMMLGVLGTVLMLGGCDPMVAEDLVIDSDILMLEDGQSHIDDIQTAFDTWNETFACPHSIRSIADIDIDSRDSIVLDTDYVQSFDGASGRFFNDVPNIVFAESTFEFGRAATVANVLHELGHAHGAIHSDTGLMRYDVLTYIDVDTVIVIDDSMQVAVTTADPSCIR